MPKQLDQSTEADYKCTNCGQTFDRSALTAKKVLFQALGSRGRWERSRTVAWLCPACKLIDEDWNREPNKGRHRPPVKGVTNG